jgi:hypothetical protein
MIWSLSYNEATETLTIVVRIRYNSGFNFWLFQRIDSGAAAHATLANLCAGSPVTIPFNTEADAPFNFCVLNAATVTMQLVFP